MFPFLWRILGEEEKIFARLFVGKRTYPRYVDTCDNGFREIVDGKRLGNVGGLFVLEGSARSKFIDYRNLFETSIETNTIENAIPFDRFYPLLSSRYNLTVHRGISSYNHDRVRSVSLKWKIVRNG